MLECLMDPVSNRCLEKTFQLKLVLSPPFNRRTVEYRLKAPLQRAPDLMLYMCFRVPLLFNMFYGCQIVFNVE